MSIVNPEETNARIIEANEYLHQHSILELFEDLCTLLSYSRPSNVKQFLIDELKNRREKGPAGHVIFTEQEIQNVFTLFDLRQEQRLNREQCKEALRTIAHSAFQHSKVDEITIPETVDVGGFQNLCKLVLS